MTRNVLVTGATGYVGGRLVPRLLEEGHPVRCLVRDPARLQGRPWFDQVDLTCGDLLRPETLKEAFEGVDTAFFLVHTMQGGEGFHERDLDCARNFAQAARAAGVRRIVYLGALGRSDDGALSKHLRSRQAVADELRAHGPDVLEFRAGVIVGSGSLSFELIRDLTERLPVMICPRWVYTLAQPIAIRDVLSYLVGSIDAEGGSHVVEIGGAQRLSYGDMMMGYAKARGLRRYMIPVPVLTPRLSSYWVHFVTPVPSSIARPLIEGLRNEVVADTREARRLFPHIDPITYDEAVDRALRRIHDHTLNTTWYDSLSSSMRARPVELHVTEGMIVERRVRRLEVSPADAFRAFSGLGGERGWLYLDWTWRVRGIIDRLLGGVGMRRGRRHPDEVRVGDVVDFWRVEAVEPDRLMRLRAEMKVPGRAWLQFEAVPTDEGCELRQTAFFAPRGLFGLMYWYLLYPVHGFIFGGLVDGVARLAREARAARREEPRLPQAATV